MDTNLPGVGIRSSVQHLPVIQHPSAVRLSGTAVLDMYMFALETHDLTSGDQSRYNLLSPADDKATRLMEQLERFRTELIQTNQLIERKRKLEMGAFGIRHGRLASRVLSVLSAVAWSASLAADIWNEVSRTVRDKTIVLVSDAINIVALLLTSCSLYGWYQYTSALKKAEKKNPASEEEIDRNKRILSVLEPASLFLQTCKIEAPITLLSYLNSVRIQHEYLHPDDKIRFPIAEVIKCLIYVLPKEHSLRADYEEANEPFTTNRDSPGISDQDADEESPRPRINAASLHTSGIQLERAPRGTSPIRHARNVDAAVRKRLLEQKWGFALPEASPAA